jgi:cation diffusion facilitator CzcD-associated flavoprotein CzcO
MAPLDTASAEMASPTKPARDAVLDVAIIGAGFAGLCMAIRLRQAGMQHFQIFEKSDGVGGTWHDNTYPGSGCDVPSHLYCFSFAPKSDWSRVYAEQPEILAYLEDCAEKFGLIPHLRLNTEIADARFDKANGLWHLVTASGEQVAARLLVSGTGQLNRPTWPAIEGLEDFAGIKFHSARWDHGADLRSKRIAVIGNGASAVQFVPRIAPEAKALYLYQRSSNWVVPKLDRPYTESEQTRFRNLPGFAWFTRFWIYLTLERNYLAFIRDSWFGKRFVKVAEAQLEQIADPTLRKRLRPDYPLGCKRVLISNDFYPALQLPQVEIVTDPIQRVDSHAIIGADGKAREVDAIIFATGFDSLSFLAPMEIVGSEGKRIQDVWREGAEAYLGMSVPGFPNFFMLYGPNTNLGHNSIILMLEAQTIYVLKCIRAVLDRQIQSIEIKPEAMLAFNQRLQHDIARSVWAGGCRSWYKTASGKVTNNWPGFVLKYWLATRRVKFDDYRVARGE